MRLDLRFVLGLFISSFALSSTSFAQQVGFGGGELTRSGDCLTQDQLAAVREVMREHGLREQAAAGLPPGALAASSSPPKFTFYPMGANLYGDVFVNNFNDLDGSSDILDWDCTGHTYNGHDATDDDLRGFDEQEIGVPIFAALDGTVIGLNDGEPDRNTNCSSPQANYVILAHAGGRNTYYWHMKTGSVAVTMGQSVRAGEQIGLVASSGCSTAPHLHFATYDNFGSTRVEPFTGACNPGASQWEEQPELRRDLYIGDMNFTDANIAQFRGLPFSIPRSVSLPRGVRPARFWIQAYNLPAGSTWRVRYRRPNGTTAFDSGTQNFNNASGFRSSWWWWAYSLNFDQVGTWRAEIELDGSLVQSVPVEIVPIAAAIQNRAPSPVGARFDPPLVTLD
ncbi:MAG: M23 family metallopeptidase, partial [Planctomycetota bacterium]